MGNASRFAEKGSSVDLDRIYEAASDIAAFGNLADVLASSMESSNGVLVLRQDGVPVEVSATISDGAKQAYVDYYGKIDIWTQTTASVPPFVVAASEDLIPDDQVLNSEFYVDYARHLEMFRPIGTKAIIAPGLTMMVGVNRPRTAPKYGEDDKAKLLELARHVQRALQLRRRLQSAEKLAAVGFAALEELAFGVVIAEGDGRVRFANAAAEDLHSARAGIVLRAGRISTALPGDGVRLAAMIASAASSGSGGAMRIRQQHGLPSLFALVSRLPRRLAEPADKTDLALIALRLVNSSIRYVEGVLSSLFGLSPAEAQITVALMRGERLEAISLAREVQMTTIKTQMESIFRKTSTESQRDLIRLLGSLPQTKSLGEPDS